MKKYLCVFCFFWVSVQAQKVEKIGSVEQKADELNGLNLFEEAIVLYKKSEEKSSKQQDNNNHSRIYAKIAGAYKNLFNYKAAMVWYKKYMDVADPAKDSIKIIYCDLLRTNAKCEEVENILASITESKYLALAKLQRESCLYVFEHDSINPHTYIKKTNLNTGDRNLGIALFNQGVLSSAPEKSKEGETEFYQMRYFKLKDSLRFGNAQLLKDFPETRFHQGAPSMSSDKKTLYFTMNNSEKKKLLDTKNANKRNKMAEDGSNTLRIVSSYYNAKDSSWGEEETLPFCQPAHNYTHPFIDKDNKTLYFVSDQDSPERKMNIFISRKNIKNEWTTPKMLDTNINTASHEVFPFVFEDYLYFASYGKPGYGGADLFKSKINADGSYSKAENLGKPINSSFDDFGMVLLNEKKGYLISNRDDKIGADDLFYFWTVNPPKIIAKPEPKIEETVAMAEEKLESIQVAGVHFENVLFGFDEYVIDLGELPKLNKLLDFLNKNNKAYVRLEGHTDSKGSDTYNKKLSKNRAYTIYNFLIAHKIKPEKISYVYFGKSNLLHVCNPCTAKQNKENRRVEIKIVEKEQA